MRGHHGQGGTSPYESSVSSMYHSPMAAMLATSPEFHAQAHAAAMAALQVKLLPFCPLLGTASQHIIHALGRDNGGLDNTMT